MPVYYNFRSPGTIPYNRENAVSYAHRWAMSRNPGYYDFEKLGGDCTNFASQALYAGSGVMNFTPVYGWYYSSVNNRSPSWTGVNFLYNFLVKNQGIGPYAAETDFGDAMPGDIIQLSFGGKDSFDHSHVIVKTGSSASPGNILIAAHTYDRDNYPLILYNWNYIRVLHILGVRVV